MLSLSLRAYETLSETEFSIRPDDNGFRPNLWIDISPYLEEKIEIMRYSLLQVRGQEFQRRGDSTKNGAAEAQAKLGI